MEKAHFLWDKTKLTKEWEPQGPGIERQELLTKGTQPYQEHPTSLHQAQAESATRHSKLPTKPH